MDRMSPSLRPTDRPAGFQRWRSLLFLHWELPAPALAALLPAGLSLDTFEGRAYVGLVPFTMRDVSPWWSPSVPGISSFHELNLRTYVHLRGEQPGVWFFSLDAASSVAVVLARSSWSLPYYRASMKVERRGDELTYDSRRLWPSPKPAELALRYRIGEPREAAAPGSFEHFLTERYLLFASTPFGLAKGQVHHRTYPLRRAEVLELRENIVTAAGLPAPVGPPHVLFSEGVDVDVYALERIGLQLAANTQLRRC
jgi:uncharacterized protein